jgi:hypothetical protein
MGKSDRRSHSVQISFFDDNRAVALLFHQLKHRLDINRPRHVSEIAGLKKNAQRDFHLQFRADLMPV